MPPALTVRGFVERRVDDGPEVDDPAQQNDPQQERHDEHESGQNPASLEQLAQAGNEKTGQGGQYVAAGSSLILINGVGAAFGPLIVSTLMSVFGTNMYFPTLSIIFFILFLYGLYRSKVRAPIPVEEQSEAMVTVPRSAPIVMNITEEQSDKDK